jgi:hypothetical protein
LEVADLNGDGFEDFITVNGDNGDGGARTKPYHGLRLHLNDGHGAFHEARFLPMAGAYHVEARDFDEDGDMDLAAIAYFPDFEAAPEEGFVYWENAGGMRFEPRVLPEAAQGRWICMASGDVDGDGDEDVLLGSFIRGPTTMPIPSTLQDSWQRTGPPVLWLRNPLR